MKDRLREIKQKWENRNYDIVFDEDDFLWLIAEVERLQRILDSIKERYLNPMP